MVAHTGAPAYPSAGGVQCNKGMRVYQRSSSKELGPAGTLHRGVAKVTTPPLGVALLERAGGPTPADQRRTPQPAHAN